MSRRDAPNRPARRGSANSMRLFYFSPVPWDSYEQRPHYFVRYFLASGGAQVTWVNPHAARLPRLGDLGRLGGVAKPRPLWLDRPAGLRVLSVRALPMDPLPGGALLNETLFWRRALDDMAREAGPDTIIGIGRPTALALAALRKVPHGWSFYDAMDMFPEFYRGISRRFTHRIEGQIGVGVTRIFASSSALAEKCRWFGPPVTLMRNAYDMSLLPPVGGAHAGAPGGLGFLGCMGRWFDWGLAVRIAEAVGPMPVTLVGPRPVPGPSRLPSNMTWHRERHQQDIVSYLSTFAVGLIPFRRDALTAGVDPIKYYQYRGAGLPVLTTSFGEMIDRTEADDTFFLDRGRDLMNSIAGALARRPTGEAMGAFRRENSWSARFSAADVLSPP